LGRAKDAEPPDRGPGRSCRAMHGGQYQISPFFQIIYPMPLAAPRIRSTFACFSVIVRPQKTEACRSQSSPPPCGVGGEGTKAGALKKGHFRHAQAGGASHQSPFFARATGRFWEIFELEKFRSPRAAKRQHLPGKPRQCLFYRGAARRAPVYAILQPIPL
jgi:hypothetical protein